MYVLFCPGVAHSCRPTIIAVVALMPALIFPNHFETMANRLLCCRPSTIHRRIWTNGKQSHGGSGGGGGVKWGPTVSSLSSCIQLTEPSDSTVT